MTCRSSAAQDLSWNAGKKFMGNVDGFLKSLQSFDKDNIPMICVDKVSTWHLSQRWVRHV